MSKRFGRNRKRKLLQQLRVAEMERQAAVNRNLCCADENEELRSTLNHVELVLGKHFAALPPKAREATASACMDHYPMPIDKQTTDSVAKIVRTNQQRADCVVAMLEIMRTFSAEAWFDDLYRRMHFAIKGPVSSGYVVSETELMIGDPKHIARNVADSMCQFLTHKVAEFQRNGGKL